MLCHKLLYNFTQQKQIETNYYMVDFRNTYKLYCDKIKSPEKAPLESKCSQLSVQARSELRDKISYYYERIPKEDKILLEDQRNKKVGTFNVIITCIRASARDTPSASLLVPLRRVRITERIWLRAFGAPHKSPFGGLQIPTSRQAK